MFGDFDAVNFKPSFALVGWEMFRSPEGWAELEVIRTLIYRKSAHWKLILVVLEKDEALYNEVNKILLSYGLGLADSHLVKSIEENKVRGLASGCDIIFAPSLMKELKLMPLLRSPQTARQAAEIVDHFSNCMEPFTRENYYKVLNAVETLPVKK